MHERRRETRVNVDTEITVRIYAAPELRDLEGQVFSSHTTDVSFGGLQMRLANDIPIGTLLGLEIVFEDSLMKYLHLGKVMWKKYSPAKDKKQIPYYKIGIMFETFDNSMHDLWITEIMNILEKTNTN